MEENPIVREGRDVKGEVVGGVSTKRTLRGYRSPDSMVERDGVDESKMEISVEIGSEARPTALLFPRRFDVNDTSVVKKNPSEELLLSTIRNEFEKPFRRLLCFWILPTIFLSLFPSFLSFMILVSGSSFTLSGLLRFGVENPINTNTTIFVQYRSVSFFHQREKFQDFYANHSIVSSSFISTLASSHFDVHGPFVISNDVQSAMFSKVELAKDLIRATSVLSTHSIQVRNISLSWDSADSIFSIVLNLSNKAFYMLRVSTQGIHIGSNMSFINMGSEDDTLRISTELIQLPRFELDTWECCYNGFMRSRNSQNHLTFHAVGFMTPTIHIGDLDSRIEVEARSHLRFIGSVEVASHSVTVGNMHPSSRFEIDAPTGHQPSVFSSRNLSRIHIHSNSTDLNAIELSSNAGGKTVIGHNDSVTWFHGNIQLHASMTAKLTRCSPFTITKEEEKNGERSIESGFSLYFNGSASFLPGFSNSLSSVSSVFPTGALFLGTESTNISLSDKNDLQSCASPTLTILTHSQESINLESELITFKSDSISFASSSLGKIQWNGEGNFTHQQSSSWKTDGSLLITTSGLLDIFSSLDANIQAVTELNLVTDAPEFKFMIDGMISIASGLQLSVSASKDLRLTLNSSLYTTARLIELNAPLSISISELNHTQRSIVWTTSSAELAAFGDLYVNVFCRDLFIADFARYFFSTANTTFFATSNRGILVEMSDGSTLSLKSHQSLSIDAKRIILDGQGMNSFSLLSHGPAWNLFAENSLFWISLDSLTMVASKFLSLNSSTMSYIASVSTKIFDFSSLSFQSLHYMNITAKEVISYGCLLESCILNVTASSINISSSDKILFKSLKSVTNQMQHLTFEVRDRFLSSAVHHIEVRGNRLNFSASERILFNGSQLGNVSFQTDHEAIIKSDRILQFQIGEQGKSILTSSILFTDTSQSYSSALLSSAKNLVFSFLLGSIELSSTSLLDIQQRSLLFNFSINAMQHLRIASLHQVDLCSMNLIRMTGEKFIRGSSKLFLFSSKQNVFVSSKRQRLELLDGMVSPYSGVFFHAQIIHLSGRNSSSFVARNKISLLSLQNPLSLESSASIFFESDHQLSVLSDQFSLDSLKESRWSAKIINFTTSSDIILKFGSHFNINASTVKLMGIHTAFRSREVRIRSKLGILLDSIHLVQSSAERSNQSIISRSFSSLSFDGSPSGISNPSSTSGIFVSLGQSSRLSFQRKFTRNPIVIRSTPSLVVGDLTFDSPQHQAIRSIGRGFPLHFLFSNLTLQYSSSIDRSDRLRIGQNSSRLIFGHANNRVDWRTSIASFQQSTWTRTFASITATKTTFWGGIQLTNLTSRCLQFDAGTGVVMIRGGSPNSNGDLSSDRGRVLMGVSSRGNVSFQSNELSMSANVLSFSRGKTILRGGQRNNKVRIVWETYETIVDTNVAEQFILRHDMTVPVNRVFSISYVLQLNGEIIFVSDSTSSLFMFRIRDATVRVARSANSLNGNSLNGSLLRISIGYVLLL